MKLGDKSSITLRSLLLNAGPEQTSKEWTMVRALTLVFYDQLREELEDVLDEYMREYTKRLAVVIHEEIISTVDEFVANYNKQLVEKP